MRSLQSLQFLLFVCGALLLGVAPVARAQRAAWQQSQMGFQYRVFANPQVLATDSAGNSYVSGGFWSVLRVPGQTLQAGGPPGAYRWDAFIAKYDAAGHMLWLQHGTGPGDDVARGVALDARRGALYVTGQNAPGFRLGGATLDSAGTYLAQLDTRTGAVRWLRSVGRPPITNGFLSRWLEINTLTVAPDHSLYLSGRERNVDSLDALPLAAHTPLEIVGLLAHCTPGGVFTDVYELLGGTSHVASAMPAPNGDVVLMGTFSDTVQFGVAANSPTLTSRHPTDFDVFVARLSATGTTRWVRQLSDAQGTLEPGGLTLDGKGNAYVSGSATAQVRVQQILAADSGQFSVKLDPAGTVRWIKTFPGNSTENSVRKLLVGTDGRLYSVGFVRSRSTSPDTAIFDSFELLTSSSFSPLVLCQDTATGTVQWAKSRDAVTICGSNFGIDIQADAQNRLYVLGFGNCPNEYDGIAVEPRGAFLLRLDPSAFLGGAVYLDTNSNGRRDPGEGAFPRPIAVREQQRADVYTTNSVGSFNAFVAPGPYALSVAALPAYYTLSAPATGIHRGTLASNGARVDTLTFGLRPVAGQQDLRVSLTPYSRARPGQLLRYRARVENVGTTTVASGQVSVTLDARATIIGTAPVATLTQGQTRGWTISNLAPFATREYDVMFSLPVTTPLGTSVRSGASVTPLSGDVAPADNTDSLRQTVSNSADPNAITVNHVQLTLQQIASGQPLDYTIQFENMGNDTAHAVTLLDTLPAGLLQLGTARLVAQSHNCNWQIVGRVLRVWFPGIALPNRAVDAIRSKGFVRFRVTPETSLGVGTLIPNTAHITFDFNLPLATNQATTLVQTPNGLVAEAGAATWSLYPNPAPAAGRVTLTADVTTAGPATVALLDALGRVVRTETTLAPAGSWTRAVATAGLTPGLYVVRLTLPDGGGTSRRLVVGAQ